MDITKLELACKAALLFLRGEGTVDAEFELKDIQVEEISFVDRAANRRPFLVVKRAGGAMGAAVDEATGNQENVMLQTGVKEELLKMITQALESLVAVSNIVKEASETSEGGENLPIELSEPLQGISDLLQGTLSRYPSPMTEGQGEVQQALRRLGNIAIDLAKGKSLDGKEEQIAELVSITRALRLGKQEGMGAALAEAADGLMALAGDIGEGEASEEQMAMLQQLCEQIAALLPGAEEAAAPDKQEGEDEESEEGETPPEEEDEEEMPTEAAAPASGDPAHVDLNAMSEEELNKEFDAALQELGGTIPTETNHKFRVLAAAIMRIADAPDAISLNNIRREMTGLAKALTTVKVDVAKMGGNEQAEQILWMAMERIRSGELADQPIKDAVDMVMEALRQALGASPEEAAAAMDKVASQLKTESETTVSTLIATVKDLTEEIRTSLKAKSEDKADEEEGKADEEEGKADEEEDKTEDAEKRHLEGQPLNEITEPGDMNNVGTGPTADKPVHQGNDELAEITKRLESLQKQVVQLGGDPETPASRTEPGNGNNGRSPRRQRSGNPWVW